MSFDTVLIDASCAAGITYSLMIGQPASPGRTLAKAAAVGALAVLAYVRGAPTALVVALMLSTLGDAFLAGDPGTWLPAGLSAFLLAHGSYIWLFVQDGGGRAALAAEPLRAVGVISAFAAGLMMLAWLWRSLGAGLRGAVALYALALSAMVAAAFTLPKFLWPAMAGAVWFMTSDALLAAELFKGLRSRLSGQAVWWLYYAAQGATTYAYLR